MSESGAASVGASGASAEVVEAEAAEGRERRRRKLEAAVAYHERDLGLVDEAIQNTAHRAERLAAEMQAVEKAGDDLAALRSATEEAIVNARADLAAFDGGGA